MGLSQNAFNAAAVRFSAFADTVAGPGGDVIKIIQDITGRASDFASVMNLDVTEAMGLFQSGLAGETEPLRRYGIDVSAAAVKTFAYANGIAAAGAELTEAEKVQGRYGLLMEQTAAAAGDFANTSDSLANSQRILNAEFENAQAIVGNLMVPGLEALNAVLIPLVQAFNDAHPAVQLVVGGLVLLGAGVLRVTSGLAPMLIAMNAAGISMQTMAARARMAALALGPVVAVLAAVELGSRGLESVLFKDLNPQIDAMTVGLEKFTQTGKATGELSRVLGDDIRSTGDELERILNDRWWDKAGRGIQDFVDKVPGTFGGTMLRIANDLELPREKVVALDQALAGMARSGNIDEAEAGFARLTTEMGLTEHQTEMLRGMLGEWAAAAEVGAAQTDKLTGAQEDAAAATDSHTESLQALADELRAQTDPMFAFTKAQQDLRDAQKGVTEAEEDHGRKSPQYQNALRGEAEAAIAVLDAAGELGDEFTGKLSDAQRQMLRDAGLSDAAIRRLETDLKDAKREADRLDGTRIRITTTELRITQHQNVFLAPVGSRQQAMAHGGISGAQGGGPRGRRVLVGEQGPELVDLAPGSTVHTADATQAMLAAGNGFGGPLRLEVVPGISGDRLLDALIESLSLRVRTQAGGSVQTLLGGGGRG
jgi:hypothetical protein